MAFPTVIGVSHYTSTDWTASHAVPLPTNSTADRLLLMMGTFGGDVPSVNVPSGWTEKVTQNTNGGNMVCCIFAKKTTGSEGSTQTVTTGGDGILAASTYLIGGWRGTSAADDVKAVLEIPTAGISAPWPTPNLDPGWGAEDTLWFVVSADLAASTWTLAAPTDYSGLERALAGNHRSVYTARRELNASSHNPADWTVATGSYHSTRWYNEVATLAVRPAESTPIPVFHHYYAKLRA